MDDWSRLSLGLCVTSSDLISTQQTFTSALHLREINTQQPFFHFQIVSSSPLDYLHSRTNIHGHSDTPKWPRSFGGRAVQPFRSVQGRRQDERGHHRHNRQSAGSCTTIVQQDQRLEFDIDAWRGWQVLLCSTRRRLEARNLVDKSESWVQQQLYRSNKLWCKFLPPPLIFRCLISSYQPVLNLPDGQNGNPLVLLPCHVVIGRYSCEMGKPTSNRQK